MLGFIPANSQVTVITASDKVDAFGIALPDVESVYNCYLSMNSKHEKVVNNLGNEVVFTASMLFNSDENVKITVGDKIIFADDTGKKQKKLVIAVNYKRDFAGQITAVKAVV